MNNQNLDQFTLIALVGFMGSGKSTVGKLLAESLDYAFIDTDEEIAKAENQTISDIFENQGEAHFRELEHQLIKKMLHSTKIVISTGGGLPIYHDNMTLLNANCVTIYLKVSTNSLINRLRKHSNRPLVADKSIEEMKEYIDKTLHFREKFYLQAQCIVDGNAKVQKVIEEIRNKVNVK